MIIKYLRPSYNGGADEQLERALARIADLEEEYENLEAARDREVARLESRNEVLLKALAQDPMQYVVVYRTAADARIKRQLTHHMREMRRIHGNNHQDHPLS